MLNIIAKKYTQALIETMDDINETFLILKEFSSVLSEKWVADILASPFISKIQKEDLLLHSVDSSNEKLKNFLRLLAESDRILLIPHICNELEKRLLAHKREYVAVLVSKKELDNKTLESIQISLSKRLGVKLSIKQKQSDMDGIKLSVEDLGIEVAFSKERFGDDLKHHILKAL